MTRSRLFALFGAAVVALAAHPVLAKEAAVPVPLGNPGDWLRKGDYPPAALRNEVEGTTSFRLEVGPNGRVRSCIVTISSGSSELDDATCRVIPQRALFTPAKDRKGRPVAGSYQTRVRWVIPKDRPMPEPGFSSITALVGPDGTVTDCRIEAAEGSAARQAQVGPTDRCPFANIPHGFSDASGQPVAKRLRLTIRVEVLDAAGNEPAKPN